MRGVVLAIDADGRVTCRIVLRIQVVGGSGFCPARFLSRRHRRGLGEARGVPSLLAAIAPLEGAFGEASGVPPLRAPIAALECGLGEARGIPSLLAAAAARLLSVLAELVPGSRDISFLLAAIGPQAVPPSGSSGC